MKTSVDLPPELVLEIKHRAVNEGRKLKEVVAELLRFVLDQVNAHAKALVPRKSQILLPLFPSFPNAPASQMDITALIALEHVARLEEDHARHG